jgi:hypothetical protein
VGPGPEPFSRWPYLTRVTETGARLRWIARDGAAVRMSAVGPDGRRVAARGGVLSGLRPDTRYSWTAEVDGRQAATGAFATAPRALMRRLTLVAFGDHGHLGREPSFAVGRLAAAQRPRLVLTTGDVTSLVTVSQVLDPFVFRPLREVLAGAPNYGVVGDHDILAPAGQRALVRAFDWPGLGERYVLRYGPLQVVGLGLRADSADVPFLRRALAARGPRVRFVLVHQPPKAGNPILPLLPGSGVAAVLSGHLHAYERRARPEAPGVAFFTVGTGGASASPRYTPRSPDALTYLVEHGLLRIDLGPARIVYRFLDVEGRVRDSLVRPLP